MQVYFLLERSGLGAQGRHMVSDIPGAILVIDDEPSVVRALTGLLRRDGYLVGTASNGQHALTQLQERRYDILLCDLRMPELDGPALYDILTSQYPHLRQRIIFLTGDTLSIESTAFLERSGQPCVPKPCNPGSRGSGRERGFFT